ncbi:hypothetical protein D9758_007596 [Tetrapyrgos nigripes]|uniref:Major facilitator superfamily (MFS) profile domain-containing protein n=1 Tax=Tetrapyrgos nigripes TaxID=182062 RepID=A0A8H5G858_9AGAR|nr:hypothetical protein D9758_007596 [Tetrapyrgos nigripes]
MPSARTTFITISILCLGFLLYNLPTPTLYHSISTNKLFSFMSSTSCTSTSLSGWHSRALQSPYAAASSFEPKLDNLAFTVLHSTPVEPEGFTLALFKQGNDAIAIDASGNVLQLSESDATGLTELAQSVNTLPKAGGFRNTWRITQLTTSQPIERVLVKDKDGSSLKETSVQGFANDKKELKSAVGDATELPDVLYTFVGLALEAREGYERGNAGGVVDRVKGLFPLLFPSIHHYYPQAIPNLYYVAAMQSGGSTSTLLGHLEPSPHRHPSHLRSPLSFTRRPRLQLMMPTEEKRVSSEEKFGNGEDKVDLHHLEKGSGSGHEEVEADSEAYERKIVRLIDRRMLPVLGLLYSIALIDRNNLALSRTAGMEEDLQIAVGYRYSIISLLFFIPYTLLELPSNLLLRQFGVRNCLTFYIAAWGAVQLGMAFVKSWQQLAGCRVLLGALEAGFFPAMTFIITTWYKRHEVQGRLTFFYVSAAVLGACSPILSYCMTLLKGRANLNGWQWIFLIEGILTGILAIVTWFFVIEFPDKNKFLTPEQTQFILQRLQKDRGDALPDELTTRKVLHHLGDWIIWAHGFMYLSATMPITAITYFNTIILRGMGWSVTASMLLITPPYFAAAIISYFIAYYSDKLKKRAIFLLFQTLATIAGLLIMAYATQNEVRYFGIFVAVAGSLAMNPSVLAYSANNVVSHSKRSVSTGVIIPFSGIGGILATTVFRQQDYPRYSNGIWAALGSQFLMLVLLAATTYTYTKRNRLAKEGKVEMLEGQPRFYYTI